MSIKLRPLSKVWLYWTLVNTTSFSTFVFAIGLASMLAQSFDVELVPPVTIMTGFVGIAQQVVLHNTVLQNDSWTFLLYIGLLFGLLAACAGLVPMALIVRGTLGEFLGVGMISFCFGAALGGFQSSGYSRNYRTHAVWIAASGLGVMAICFSLLLFFEFRKRVDPRLGDAILAATVGGSAYGAVTGGALVWLLHLIPSEYKPKPAPWIFSDRERQSSG
jgi:hypothetical protein